MDRVVYLLGAGASFGLRDLEKQKTKYERIRPGDAGTVIRENRYCSAIIEGLPIVSELPDRMDYVCSELYRKAVSVPLGNSSRSNLMKLMLDLDWVQKESSCHSTIDTFAKKLWLQKKDADYERLKRTISAYFLLEQVENEVDKRYDSFFASILGRDVSDFPLNISILSWNYDCQLELAYSRFIDQLNIDEIEQSLQFSHKTLGSGSRPCEGFNVVKLNGSAVFWDKTSSQIVNPFQVLSGEDYRYKGVDARDTVASIYADAKNNVNALSFAWEKADERFTKRIRESVKDATILVVIGYSFPFFNRAIDRLIFGSLPYLRKVYIQDKDPDGIEESVVNLLNYSDRADKVKRVKLYNTQQFYLPPEL